MANGFTSFLDVAKKGCCTSCGLCFCAAETGIRNGQPVPITKKEGCEFDLFLCPGKGYDLSEPARQKTHSSFLLGGWESFYAVRTEKPEVLKNAASGGIMTSIALKMLESGLADKIISTRIICKDGKIQTDTFATSNPEELFSSQGSKYMPIPTLARLNEIIESGKKYVYIGTPCP